MNAALKQRILDNAVERINVTMFEDMMEVVHDAMTEAMGEVCGDTINYDDMETYDVMLGLCNRVAIIGLPE